MSYNPTWSGGSPGSGKVNSIKIFDVDTFNWTVPAGVTEISIELWGKGGNVPIGSSLSGAAQNGGYISANCLVTPGDTISCVLARNLNANTSTTVSGTGILLIAKNGANDSSGNGGGSGISNTVSGVNVVDSFSYDTKTGYVNLGESMGSSPVFGGKGGSAAILGGSSENVCNGGFPGGGAAAQRGPASSVIAYGGDGMVIIYYLGT